MVVARQEASRLERSSHRYRLYGVRIRSSVPLPYPTEQEPGLADIDVVAVPGSVLPEGTSRGPLELDDSEWFHHVRLSDGSDYLRWTGLFEFLISSDSRHIACRALNGTSLEAFHTYLASQVLSFALLKQGAEPLHATVAVIDEQAVAFLGDCGYGKSTLGAAFLQAGHRLLTDDLLVVESQGTTEPRFLVHPGPPRLKVFPEIAQALLGDLIVGTPMNPYTSKLVIPLDRQHHSITAAPLKAIYVLRPSMPGREARRFTIRNISRRRAFLDLIANTFNDIITDPCRLKRQFDWAISLAAAIPIRSLSFPRDLARLPAVVDAIHANLTA